MHRQRVVKKQIVLIVISVIVALLVCNCTEEMSEDLINSKISGKVVGVKIVLDESGVPIVDYGKFGGKYIGKQRNPVAVSQKAFDYWDGYQNDGDERSKQRFLNCANWLVENAISHDNFSLFEYEFPLPQYNMTPPWRSGMAQGQGIQVLIRAYNLTGDKKYLDVAERSLKSFFVEVEDGGVTYKTSTSGYWYEEYADEHGKNSRVLNGMMYSLIGLHEYYERTGSKDAKILFNQGILALKNNLSSYDSGDWTYYNALGKPAIESYHHIHITQLSLLSTFTNEPIFKIYHDKWESYERSPFLVRLIKNHTKMGIAVFGMNFVVLLMLFEIATFAVEHRKERKE